MYNDGGAYERMLKWGATGLDEMSASGSFVSGSTRFVYPKAPLKSGSGTKNADSGYYMVSKCVFVLEECCGRGGGGRGWETE